MSKLVPFLKGFLVTFLFSFFSFSLQSQTGQALCLDNSNDRISIPLFSNQLTTEFTLEAWVKVGTSNDEGAIIHNHQDNTSGVSLYVWSTEFRSEIRTSSGSYNVAISKVPYVNQWVHLASVYDGSSFTMYLNGAVASSTPASGTLVPNNESAYLGYYPQYGAYFNGSIDEVRIWNRALSSCEINHNRNNELPNPNNQTGLLTYYDFNQGTAGGSNSGQTTLFDDSGNGNNGTLQNFALSGSCSNWITGSNPPNGQSSNPSICNNGNPITLSTQQQVDDFASTYGCDCNHTGNLAILGASITSITNLAGLAQLDSISGDLGIFNNAALTSLSGLDSLTSISGYLAITNNAALTSLSGLDNLTSIGGFLDIVLNAALTSLSGLDNITPNTISNLTITNNSMLTTCEVQSVCDYLAISTNTASIIGNATNCNSRTEVENACDPCNSTTPLSCNNGNPITLSTQQQVDDFASTYGCDCNYTGDLRIQQSADITSLSGLAQLDSIGGILAISNNAALTTLSDLNNLTSISGLLFIGSNAALTSLSGLDSLTSIGGFLSIYNNASLTSLNGLDNITSVGGYLDIDNNNALTSLTSLDSLTSLGGNLRIFDNASLTSLSGLDNITSIGGNLDLRHNPALTTCEVQSVCDYLAISTNTASIIGNATNCNSRTEIEDACAPCNSTTALICNNGNPIYLSTQQQVDDFASTYGCDCNYTGDLTIQGGSSITSLSGLAQLDSIGGDLKIIVTTTLTSLSGLDNITTIGGFLDIGNNAVLTSLSGLDSLTTIGGNLAIYNNASLMSLSGLDSLTSIGSYLYISQNTVLTSLSGLDNITSIGSYLDISYNTALTSLSSLDNITSIGNYLYISSNAALMSLSGLDNITPNTISNLTIFNNNMLTTCEVQSVCDYLAISGSTATIYSNATNCNSRTEIEDACAPLINDDCAGAINLNGGGVAGMPTGTPISSTTIGATDSGIPSCNGTDVPDDDVWFEFTTNASGGDVTVSIVAAGITSPVCEIFLNCTVTTPIVCGTTSTVLSGTTPNTQYFIRVYDAGTGFVGGADERSAGGFTIEVSGTALPAEIVSFTGKAMDKYNALTWETASEYNTSEFAVERSLNGRDNWELIGTERAAGNSDTNITYNFDDMRPVSHGYYRLNTIDLDGSSQVSNIVSIKRDAAGFDVVLVAPNPTTARTVVTFESANDRSVNVIVTDITGKIISNLAQEAIGGLNNMTIDLSNTPSGVYFLSMNNGETSITRRIVKN